MRLQISRRKRAVFRCLYFGGFAIALFGILLLWRESPAWRGAVLGGAFAAVIGGFSLEGMYSCPVCGSRLLDREHPIGAMMGRTVKHCPGCGQKVEIEEV